MFNSYVVFNINYHNDYYVTTPSSWPDHFKIACYSPGLSKLKTATKKRDTLKLQINFHRKCWDRHTLIKMYFFFYTKGSSIHQLNYSVTHNLIWLLPSEQKPQQQLDTMVFSSQQKN